MSIWHTVDSKEDIAIDGDKINILYDSDYNGNMYVEIPLEIMRQIIVDHDKQNPK